MLELTENTSKDAKSMQVIAVVTLIFLPASFVSVRYLIRKEARDAEGKADNFYQSLYSTSVINFNQADAFSYLTSPDFKTYMEITLTLMIVTGIITKIAHLRVWRRSQGPSHGGQRPTIGTSRRTAAALLRTML